MENARIENLKWAIFGNFQTLNDGLGHGARFARNVLKWDLLNNFNQCEVNEKKET